MQCRIAGTRRRSRLTSAQLHCSQLAARILKLAGSLGLAESAVEGAVFADGQLVRARLPACLPDATHLSPVLPLARTHR